MSEKITIVGAGDGFGGLMQAFACAHFVQRSGYEPLIVLACNDVVFDGLYYLFSDKFKLLQIPEEEGFNNRLVKDPSSLQQYGIGVQKLFIVTPDLVFRHPFAFNAKQFKTSYSAIKSHRLLSHRYKPENIISLCLNTSTPSYVYRCPIELIKLLSKSLPDYRIYYPFITEWAGHSINQDINIQEIKHLPNVIVDVNPNFVDSLKMLEKSDVCVCCDNGPSHASYALEGQVRVLLDPHFYNSNFSLWVSRWRETLDDSVPLNFPAREIANLVNTLITIPQVSLLPKYMILNNKNYNQSLGFKEV